MQDRDSEADGRRRAVRWGAIAPAWLFFYAFIVLQGLTPICNPFHGGMVSIVATAKLVSALHAFCPADGHSIGESLWQTHD